MLGRGLYRSRQFFSSLRPRVDAAARHEAFALLSDGERALFETMTPRDQQHCLNVYRRLRDEGHAERDPDGRSLLAAALLHDAGKGRIALWHRVVFVLLEAGAPGVLRRVAEPGDGTGWRQALHRCLHHAELGAEAARSAGSSERTVALIREDGSEAPPELLLALKGADDSV
ncbi:MAG: hypothetical protein WEE64_07810 [Dehalococcoidia bacterium]